MIGYLPNLEYLEDLWCLSYLVIYWLIYKFNLVCGSTVNANLSLDIIRRFLCL